MILASYRLLLADDHTLLRLGIRKMLEAEPALRVVGEAADGLELLDLLKRNRDIDLILLDVSMPNLQGIEAIPLLRKLCPRVKILILSMHKNEQYLCAALSAGANGYILKEDSDTELLPAIASVLRGRFVISSRFAEKYQEDPLGICREEHPAKGAVLSFRELQILHLVAEGITSKGIGEKLNISKRTAEHHRASLMRKLGASKTADLVRYAIQRGLIPPPPP
ncbi:response regulator [Thiovibrio sp. JS02]